MKVIIVGAGIAGLSAGIALRHSGHEVLILERSSLLHEVGAAIHVPPNAMVALRPWGFDVHRARAVQAEKVQQIRTTTDTPTIMLEGDHTLNEKRHGNHLYFCHRVDLHNELVYLATREDASGSPAKIMTGMTVDGFDVDAGRVFTQDGSSYSGDLLVCADGVRSIAASKINFEPVPAYAEGRSIFRFLIPTEEIAKDPETCEFLNGKPAVRTWLADHRKLVVTYPCRDGLVQNFAAVFPDPEEDTGTEEWNRPATFNDMMKIFKGVFHHTLNKVMEKGEDIKFWKLIVREPLPEWHKGRLVMIGDAAHMMLPFMAQGAAQAIEDGAALGAIFSDIPSEKSTALREIESRLHLFQSVRKYRTTAVQAFSYASAGEEADMRERAKRFVDPDHIPENILDFQNWNFSYDIVKECNEAMAQAATGSDHTVTKRAKYLGFHSSKD